MESSAKPHSECAAVLIYGLLSHRTYDSLCLLLAGDFPWELFSPLQTPGRGPPFLKCFTFPLKTVVHGMGIISALVSIARLWPWVQDFWLSLWCITWLRHFPFPQWPWEGRISLKPCTHTIPSNDTSQQFLQVNPIHSVGRQSEGPPQSQENYSAKSDKHSWWG